MAIKSSKFQAVRKAVRRFLFSTLSKELLIFVFFVFVSASFWLMRTLNDSVEVQVVVPLKLTGVPEEVLVTSQPPKEVTAVVRDKGLSIWRLILLKRVPPVEVNFGSCETSDKQGRGKITLAYLQAHAEGLASSARIVSVSPDTIDFYYNRGQSKRLPVVFRGVLSAGNHYSLNARRVETDSVDVYAPASVLDTLQCVYTEAARLTGLTKSGSEEVPIVCQKGMRCRPEAVVVKYSVDALVHGTTSVPVHMQNFPGGKELRTFPSRVDVSYWAKAGDVNTITPDSFYLTVTYSELLKQREKSSDTKCRPILRKVPRGLHNVTMTPQEVDYIIEEVTVE